MLTLDSETPSDGTWRFLWCRLSFCCSSLFCFQATLPCHQLSALASQAREGLHQLWALPNYFWLPFLFHPARALRFRVGIFYDRPFLLTLLPDIFGATCFYQGLPGSWQFFLEVCRASCWSSKCRPNPAVFIHVNIAKVLLVVKTLKKNIFFWFSVLDSIRLSSRSATTLINQQPWKHKAAATLISNHKLQNNCYLKKYISEYKCKNYVNLSEFMWIYG